jgi:hypothetical protein
MAFAESWRIGEQCEARPLLNSCIRIPIEFRRPSVRNRLDFICPSEDRIVTTWIGQPRPGSVAIIEEEARC